MSPQSYTLFWFWANQSLLFLLNAVCLAEKQQIPILWSLVWPDRSSNPLSTALEATTVIITPPMWFYSLEKFPPFQRKMTMSLQKISVQNFDIKSSRWNFVFSYIVTDKTCLVYYFFFQDLTGLCKNHTCSEKEICITASPHDTTFTCQPITLIHVF